MSGLLLPKYCTPVIQPHLEQPAYIFCQFLLKVSFRLFLISGIAAFDISERAHFEHSKRRVIIGVQRHDRLTNDRIIEKADTTSFESHIVRLQVRRTGHAMCMQYTRVSKQLLFAQLSSRSTGPP